MGFKQRVEEILEFKEGFVDRLSELFGKYGLFVYDHPYMIIGLSLLFSVVPAFGFLPSVATWVEGADNLYALPVSRARNEGIVHDSLFSDAISRASFVVLASNPPGDNILTWDLLEYARQVDRIVRGQAADPVSGDLIALPANEMYYPEWFEANQRLSGTNESLTPDKLLLTYQDMCAPDPVTGCKVQSIFEMGIDDMKLLVPDGNPPELWLFDGIVFSSNRKGFSPTFGLGSPAIVDCVRDIPTQLISQIFTPDRYRPGSKAGFSEANIQCVISAKAFHFVYEMWHKPEFLPRELAWETRFYDVLQANKDFGPLQIGANAFRSRDDELNKSTAESDDIIFVLYTFILLVSFATVINFSCDQYRSKAISSLAGSVSCVLGLYAGLGIPSLIWGTAFVPTALVAPFLVIGVGADDIFVIISSYALAYAEDSPRDRCSVCLRGCGVSVVMTTITNVIAFAIGIQSPYLSIKNFCIFTLFGLFFSLVYEMTLFFAFVCLEARKEENQRACIFCAKPRGGREETVEERTAFDIHKVVSTFQVGSVLVEEATKNCKQTRLKPHPRQGKGGWVKRFWTDLNGRGNYLFKPDPALTAGGEASHSRQTTGTGSCSPGGESSSDWNDVASKSAKSPDQWASEKTDPMSEEMLLRFLPKKPVLNRFDLNKKLQVAVYRTEPQGNVGKRWRYVFARYYAMFLLHPWVKVGVLVVFTLNFGAIAVGLSRLKQGLEMKDLSPDNSYLKLYDSLVAEFLTANDLPIEVFYPEKTPWHEKRAIESLRSFVKRVNARPENQLLNDPLTRMYDDPSLGAALQSNDASVFYPALKRALSDANSAYKQFELDFVWKGDELVSFRQQLLPTGTKSSKERAHWMLTFRADVEWAAQQPDGASSVPLDVMFYNFMLVFNESDIQLTASVISSLSTASMAMFIVALMLIPDLASGLLVIVLMLLIDAAIIGYMAFWDVNLNMISMVILVISIGFAVDYSAHLCYAFVNGVGASRNIRTTEAIILVGTPLFHGAASNFLGILLLGMSTSYILRIFFKMMTLVIIFGISHGMILLPVLLSLIGPVAASVPVYDDEPEALKMMMDHSDTLLAHDARDETGRARYDEVNLSAFPAKSAFLNRKGSALDARQPGSVAFILPEEGEGCSRRDRSFHSEAKSFESPGATPLPRRRH